MIQKSVLDFIFSNNLFSRTDHLLVAISGGVDSVALADLLTEAGFKITLAHCNFQLRGEESDRDEAFVASYAVHLHAPLLVKRFDTMEYAETHRFSIQLAARKLRYNWFHELCRHGSEAPQWIVTAHHADDNIETAVLNFFRGTGIHGIRGMKPRNGIVVRPLLNIRKTDLIEYCRNKKLEWREDSSNMEDKYTRNFFRNQLIPLIGEIIPSVEENVLENLKRFQETEIIFDDAIESIRKKLITVKGEEVHIPVLKLAKIPALRTVAFELIRSYNFLPGQINDFIHLMEADTGKFIQSVTHRIIRNRRWLVIAPLNTPGAGQLVVEENDTEIRYEGGELIFERLSGSEVTIIRDSHLALLDMKHLKFPLLLRKWQTGDYFYPLGMKKKKKIARFLIDQKLSVTAKEKVRVLESNKKVLWVVGYRIDDRFKIDDTTREVLKVRLKK